MSAQTFLKRLAVTAASVRPGISIAQARPSAASQRPRRRAVDREPLAMKSEQAGHCSTATTTSAECGDSFPGCSGALTARSSASPKALACRLELLGRQYLAINATRCSVMNAVADDGAIGAGVPATWMDLATMVWTNDGVTLIPRFQCDRTGCHVPQPRRRSAEGVAGYRHRRQGHARSRRAGAANGAAVAAADAIGLLVTLPPGGRSRR